MYKRIVKRYLLKCASENNKLRAVFEKSVAPTYKSKASDQEILWATAYDDQAHPNHDQAVHDYNAWRKGVSDESISERLITDRKRLGGTLAKLSKKVAATSWKALKEFAKNIPKQAKSEIKGMMVDTPVLLAKMATGKYDFKDKDQLKKDLKTIWGSAVYYGGIAVTVMAAGPAAPAVATASKTAIALGKSVATHAAIGAASQSADFWGFLSFEAAETVAGAMNKSNEFYDLVGFASTDLFDGTVKAVSAALSAAQKLASPEEEESNQDKIMTEFLGRFLKRVGHSMQTMDESEINPD